MTSTPLSEAAFERMSRARRLEEAAATLFGMGEAGGDVRLSIGQEAVHVGLRLAMRPGDALFVGPRGLGHASAAGIDPVEILSDLRDGGVRSSRAAPAIGGAREGVFDRAREGASPLWRALGWTKAGGQGVAVVVLDDQDAEASAVLEAWRSAAAAPMLVVLEDACAHATPLPAPWSEAAIVDGLDVGAVAEAVARALERIESQGRAEVLAARVGRFRGWSLMRPDRFRARGPDRRPRGVEDALARERARLVAEGVDPRKLDAMDAAARAAAQEALAEAERLGRARAGAFDGDGRPAGGRRK
jgi:pyruvate dehydrogenase E1 component alpha subunit